MILLNFTVHAPEGDPGIKSGDLLSVRQIAANRVSDVMREFFHNSDAFAPKDAKTKVPRVTPTIKAAAIDVVKRVEGITEKEGGTMVRGLNISAEKQAEFIKDLKENGYGARKGYIAESWSSGMSTAHRFAGSKGIVLVCNKYHNRKRMDGLYRVLDMKYKNPQHPEITEGESLLPASSRFDYVNHYQKDGVTYIEVQERVDPQPS